MSYECALKTESYEEQKRKVWPLDGRHILAQYDEECIVVYQAFCPEIADYAVKHGKFGGPAYSLTRMTWVKTNFLWMMYRSGWGRKPNQERTLAIFLTRDGFDSILRGAKGAGIKLKNHLPDDVRIQWDPDHSPKGGNLQRRAIQLGLRGATLQRFHDQYIKRIEDITEYVKQQRQFVINDQLDKLMTPTERQYIPAEDICRHILLDGFESSPNTTMTRSRDSHSQVDDISYKEPGACCVQLLSNDMERLTNKGEGKSVIVCLGGAFNPVHTRHVQALEVAAQWLENNTGYRVVAGFLAVAPDGYVMNKCKRTKEPCIKAKHRLKLCELTCEGHRFFKAYHKSTIGSAQDCGERVKRELNWPYAKVAVIVGADRAMSRSGKGKWTSKSKCISVCVGRKGTTEAVRQVFREDDEVGRVVNPDFYIVDTELDDVSSTNIRKCLRQVETSDCETETSNATALEVSVSQYDVSYDVSHDVSGTEQSQENNLVTDEENRKDMCATSEEGLEADNCDSLESSSTLGPGSSSKDLNSLYKDLSSQTMDSLASGFSSSTTGSRAAAKAIDDLIRKGWLTHSAGRYMYEHFSELYN